MSQIDFLAYDCECDYGWVPSDNGAVVPNALSIHDGSQTVYYEKGISLIEAVKSCTRLMVYGFTTMIFHKKQSFKYQSKSLKIIFSSNKSSLTQI
jgi:hypothetical protein